MSVWSTFRQSCTTQFLNAALDANTFQYPVTRQGLDYAQGSPTLNWNRLLLPTLAIHKSWAKTQASKAYSMDVFILSPGSTRWAMEVITDALGSKCWRTRFSVIWIRGASVSLWRPFAMFVYFRGMHRMVRTLVLTRYRSVGDIMPGKFL